MNKDLLEVRSGYRIAKLRLFSEETKGNQLSVEIVNDFILCHIRYALALIQNRKTKQGVEVLKEITSRFPVAIKNKSDKSFLTDNSDFGNMLPGVE